MPLVSVVTPFHRMTPMLRQAVQSLRAQTLADFELLLVDNGAGTGSGPLGEAGRDERVHCLMLARPGIAAARNLAIAHARGEFIAFLDHDDLAHPPRLERQVQYLRENPRCGLVCSRVDAIDATGTAIGRQFALLDGRAQFAFSRFSMPAPLSSYLARREICARVPFREEFDFAEDYDFLARAVEVAPAGGVREVLAAYRVHPAQTTQQLWPVQVLMAAHVRLATARRRAGRPEEIPALPPLTANNEGRILVPAETYRAFAERSLAEGFGDLAIYHARKLLSVQPRAWPAAVRIFFRVLRHEPRAAVARTRLFLTGPLRTMALVPE